MYAAILLAAATVGIDYGWQPLNSGGFEYIIQIEPELLDSLRAGEVLRSDLPTNLRDVRSYRIQVGHAAVPRIGNPQPEPKSPEPVPETASTADPTPMQPPTGLTNRNWWNSPRDATPAPPIERPRDEPRYPHYNFHAPTARPRAETEVPLAEPAAPPPDRFRPDLASTSPITQTGAIQEPPAKSQPAEKNADAGPSAAKPSLPASSPKPWLPLTATLVCLFVSLGGNAYLGLQWWSTRLRCQQLLRERRGGLAPSAARASDNSALHSEDSSEADAEDDGADEDLDDEDVRAITEDELPRIKRHRPAS